MKGIRCETFCERLSGFTGDVLFVAIFHLIKKRRWYSIIERHIPFYKALKPFRCFVGRCETVQQHVCIQSIHKSLPSASFSFPLLLPLQSVSCQRATSEWISRRQRLERERGPFQSHSQEPHRLFLFYCGCSCHKNFAIICTISCNYGISIYHGRPRSSIV